MCGGLANLRPPPDHVGIACWCRVVFCSDRLHLAPPNCGSFSNSHLRGTRVPVEEPSTASNPDSMHRNIRVEYICKYFTRLPVITGELFIKSGIRA